MNAAQLALGSGLVAIGGANLGLAMKKRDGTNASNYRLAGILMMLAGAAFLAVGLASGRS